MNARQYCFNKSSRLLSSRDFTVVFDNPPFKVSHPQLLVLAKHANTPQSRLGLVIGKKNVKHAVHRNRLKRLIRESFRLKQHNLPAIDAIVLARRGADTLSNAELFSILDKLWTRVARKATK
ncbi:MAG: ribonuclease P protein component [Cellvibrionaceae bacterium]|nr:ribonuclease P protein component [Cellvibrionaceae bacterium]